MLVISGVLGLIMVKLIWFCWVNCIKVVKFVLEMVIFLMFFFNVVFVLFGVIKILFVKGD